MKIYINVYTNFHIKKKGGVQGEDVILVCQFAAAYRESGEMEEAGHLRLKVASLVYNGTYL